MILTTGSRTTRAGHGIHELFQQPAVQVATRVGRYRQSASHGSTADADAAAAAAAAADAGAAGPSSAYLVGDELDTLLADGGAQTSDIEVIYPIRGGKVWDWTALVAVWRYILLTRLAIRTAHNDCPLLVSLPATLTRDDLSRATQLLFETFNVPSLSIVEEPLLSAYAAGTLTAAVVDFGWEHCTVTPVLEASGIVHSAVQRSGVGMRHVALYLAHLLSKDESVVQALIKVDATREARGSAAARGSNDAGSALGERLFQLATLLLSAGKLKAGEEVTTGREGGGQDRSQEPEFDVAAALVAGREKAAVEEQERKNRAAIEAARLAEQGDGAPDGDAGQDGADETDAAQAGASEDEGAQTVTFQGIRIRVAPQALTQACDPLWDPTVLSALREKLAVAASASLGAADLGSHAPMGDGDGFSTLRSVPETIAASVAGVLDTDRRQQLWETLLATGAPARLIGNMNAALLEACQSCLASNADSAPGAAGGGFGGSAGPALASGGPNSRDSPGIGGGELEGAAQPSIARCIKTPDYFAEFKDRTDLAPFLGATIFAKVCAGEKVVTGWQGKSRTDSTRTLSNSSPSPIRTGASSPRRRCITKRDPLRRLRSWHHHKRANLRAMQTWLVLYNKDDSVDV